MASVHVIGSSLRSMGATERTTPSGDHNWSGGGSSPNSSLSSFALESGLAASSRCLTNGGHHPSEAIDEPKRSYSACALSLSSADSTDSIMLGFLERKPYRPFRSNEEYLVAMKEDLAEWLNTLYGLDCCADNFLCHLETGVVLCQHANSVLRKAREWRLLNGFSPFKQLSLSEFDLDRDVPVKLNANPGTFQARDNVANFINWCRRIRIHECLLFETEDLVARKNEKSFVLCLLEVARYGAKFGLLAPTLVQFEQEIDQELEQEQQKQLEHQTTPDTCESEEDVPVVFGPQPQITNNDLESLHEKVVKLLSRCTCPVQFYLEHLSEGKYRIGDTKTLIFVRILRNHVMVRVGGGWDTLEHYLEKHDPCRCRFGHRASNSARVYLSQQQAAQQQTRSAAHVQVTFDRSDPCSVQSSSAGVRRPGQLNPSPVAARRLVRPNSVTTALNSLSTSDLGSGGRRASTSSNSDSSSISSVPGCSESVSQSGPSGSNSPTSGHSSLSSSHSLTQYPSLVLPDRNNNIKGFNGNGYGQAKSSSLLNSTPPPAPPKSSPSKRRAVALPEANSSSLTHISKSKTNACTPSQTPKAKQGSGTLSAAHKHKSTSSLAISRIPCLDATNKPGRMTPRNQSTQNIYLALATEREKSTATSRRLAAPSSVGPARQRTRPTNLTKQKSSIELRNENYFSLSPIASHLNQEVPKKSTPSGTSRASAPSQPGPPHRRHHSSSLPRPSKSAQSSPYAKRRDLSLGGRKQSEAKDQLPAGPKSRFQGSATSLNSTASTGSSTSSLATADSVSNSQESVRTASVPDGPSAQPHLTYPTDHPDTPTLNSSQPNKSLPLVSKKSSATQHCVVRMRGTGPLVEVCSWFDRQH